MTKTKTLETLTDLPADLRNAQTDLQGVIAKLMHYA